MAALTVAALTGRADTLAWSECMAALTCSGVERVHGRADMLAWSECMAALTAVGRLATVVHGRADK